MTKQIADIAKEAIQKQDNKVTKANTLSSIKGLLNNDSVKKRFEDLLGKESNTFMASILSLINDPKKWQDVDVNTVISSALIAASLKLPINPNLGFAYLIPYAGKCQFQMGYKAWIQLAIRTGQYKTIGAAIIYKGQLLENPDYMTGELKIDSLFIPNAQSEKLGYASYFKLLNGFEKYYFMTKEEVNAHAKKYSQTYKSTKEWVVKDSKWTTDFDTMALKTVLKLNLSKYGILSVEMQRAIEADQAVISENQDGETIFDYVDNKEDEVPASDYEVVDDTLFEAPNPDFDANDPLGLNKQHKGE